MDFYDRSLSSGFDDISDSLIIKGVNRYLESATELKSHHIGLAHPSFVTNEFLRKHAEHCPVIEIACNTTRSIEFRYRAAHKKVANSQAVRTPRPHNFVAKRHLMIEWDELFVDSPLRAFNQIASFLNLAGDSRDFEYRVTAYMQKNKELIDSINKEI